VAKPHLERFEEKYIPEPNSGCWLWAAAYQLNGYGQFRFNGLHQMAHRVSWQLFRGNIPAGMHVLHDCDTPACVNPDHLFLGTHADNMADMKDKRRHPGGGVRGSRHPDAKLTESDVVAIRNTVGLSTYKLGAIYGVDHSTIWEILKRKKWRHVT